MAGPLARGLLPDTAEIGAEGRLSVGGCDLLDLADQFGTPLFVYDEVHLRNRCREAVAVFGDGVAYASKAFLCLAMAKLAHEEGMHVDVATGGELHVALTAGVPVVPVGLQGTQALQPVGARYPKLAKVTVAFGEPIDFTGRFDGVPAGRARREATDEIMTAIQRLSGQEQAGVYNDRAPEN